MTDEKTGISADAADFPPSLREICGSVSCLTWNAAGATWLCRLKKDNAPVVVKIADDGDAAYRLKKEKEILDTLSRTAQPAARLFPLPIALIDLDDPPHRLAFIRSWIPGRSLEALVESCESRPGLPREIAVPYVLDVLDQLDFLHHLDPAVIHRDIKPQNVIVDEEGRCRLIDFDIARILRGPGDTDTLVTGTRLTSPPEQYGFRPTDARSDIYSAGILLRYCLTGEYSETADASLPSDIRPIVLKAACFDPARRYQRAADFRSKLEKTLPAHRKKSRRRFTAGVLACIVLLFFVFFSEIRSAQTGKNAVTDAFEITEAMFGGDTALYLDFMRGNCDGYAAVVMPDGLHFVRYLSFLHQLDDMDLTERSVLSEKELDAVLNALKRSPCGQNLIILSFVNLIIESLEPFAAEYTGGDYCLEFRNCSLPKDPSPLKTIAPHLTDLACYNGTSVSWDSLDFLKTANHLNILYLVFDGSADADLSVLGSLNSPTVLCLANTAVGAEALEDIGRMERLESLLLPNCSISDVRALVRLQSLTELDLSRNQITDLSPLRRLPNLKHLYTGE